MNETYYVFFGLTGLCFATLRYPRKRERTNKRIAAALRGWVREQIRRDESTCPDIFETRRALDRADAGS